MTKTRTRYSLIAAIATILLVTGCTVSYKFNGASIDYTIRSFTNNAPLVYPALAPMFNESLRDIYAKQTRLTQVTNNGDIELEGEITGYDITPMSISDDAIAAETRLTITINVRYSNKANSDKDFERSFSAFQNFSNTQTLTQVQEQLCQTIVDEIVETIFNQTVADW